MGEGFVLPELRPEAKFVAALIDEFVKVTFSSGKGCLNAPALSRQESK